ncbi:hypothetical protein PR048_011116 [Dryococelus australis]|uniref:Uncharacterized protein n=1 Tax=Dryococelus australis TaxID=614101 RepID=A0ABQ9HL73_9NEOP|nr:hypothetical protein PR048_011116 [Dryococelus australis]
MAGDVKETLISCIRYTEFALQMGESTNVAGLTVILEDLLLRRPLPLNTSESVIFNFLDEFFSSNEIQWENCADICTDGA